MLDMKPDADGLWLLPDGRRSTMPPEFADFDDKDGWAPLQPFTGPLPDQAQNLDEHLGVRVCDVGEDGEMLIFGHLGKRRALDVFRERVRVLCGIDYANDRVFHPSDPAEVDRALQFVEHRWAVLEQRCATYPNCRSLGPVDDGKPCHDVNSYEVDGVEGAGYDAHLWAGWNTRPAEMRPATEPNHVLRRRYCERCDLTQIERVDGPVTLPNTCYQCREIDESGGLYFRWDATPDTPGAFPITLWNA